MFRDYRFVQGHEDYIVSNYGEVWSLKFGKVRLLKLNPDNKGYLQLDLSENGKRKSFKVHALVGIHFIGLRTGTLTYDHKDTNNQNNKADNIRLATKSEQAQNQNMRKTNKLGFKHISEKVVTGNEYYAISITRNGKRVQKSFNKNKYSLEQVVSERDKLLGA
jgi:hypothetical protein